MSLPVLEMLVTAFMLLPAPPPQPDAWRERLAPALERAERERSPEALIEALETAWRADDWVAGLRLVDLSVPRADEAPPDRPGAAGVERAPEQRPETRPDTRLLALAARAAWRGGQLERAEKLLESIEQAEYDNVALGTLIASALSQGRVDDAERYATRLRAAPSLDGSDWHRVFSVDLAAGRMEEALAALRQCLRRTDAANGYPQTHIAESIRGLPEFFEAIGPGSINRIARFGSVDMPVLAGFRLPYCHAFINGRGPFRLIVDTGGSITLSLDSRIAEEIDLRSLASASVHGIGGRQDSDQALADSIQLGEIEIERAMVRVFALPEPVRAAADGILGIGLLAEGRVTFDFGQARLRVDPSSMDKGPGGSAELRIIGDAKLMLPVSVGDARIWALLDTGADVLAVSPSLVRTLHPDAKPRRLPVAGQGVGEASAVAAGLAPSADYTIWGREFPEYGALTLDALDTLLSPILGIQTHALAGMPILRQMRTLTVDYPRCRAWVEWLE